MNDPHYYENNFKNPERFVCLRDTETEFKPYHYLKLIFLGKYAILFTKSGFYNANGINLIHGISGMQKT